MTALRIFQVSAIQCWFPETPNSLIVKSILTLYIFPILMLYVNFTQKKFSALFLQAYFSRYKA